MKKKIQSPSMMEITHQSKNLTRTGFNKEGVEGGVGSSARMERARNTTLVASGALQPGARSAFHVLVVVMREYFSVKNTSCNEPTDVSEL